MNILILAGRFGMGHLAAAESIALYLRQAFPAGNIIVKDFFEETMPRQSALLYRGFSLLVNKGSTFYNHCYNTTFSAAFTGFHPLRDLLASRVHRLLRKIQPDVVICTLQACVQIVSACKRRYRLDIPLITCITDVTSHNEWLTKETDGYFVPAPEVKSALIEKGISAESVYVTGVPVRPAFNEVGKNRQNMEDHFTNPNRPRRLLIMGGGLGLIPEAENFCAYLNELPNLHTTIITGSNEQLRKSLSGKFEHIEIIGQTKHPEVYMAKADCLLSKPGGSTTFEAITAGVPMAVFAPFLQQEIYNANFLTTRGMGSVLGVKSSMEQELETLLYDDSRLLSMRQSMKKFKDQLNLHRIPDIVWSILEEKRSQASFSFSEETRQGSKRSIRKKNRPAAIQG